MKDQDLKSGAPISTTTSPSLLPPSGSFLRAKRALGCHGTGPLVRKSARKMEVDFEPLGEEIRREMEISPLRLKTGKAVLER